MVYVGTGAVDAEGAGPRRHRHQVEHALGELDVAQDPVRDRMESVARDDGARVVVVASTGRAFCPGHHLKEMSSRPDLAYYQKLFSKCSKMMLGLQKLPVPVVARVHGVATAAG